MTGGGEALTLRTIDVLNRDHFHVTILTRKAITSPLLVGFLKERPDIDVVGLEAPEIGDDDKCVDEFRDHHQGRELWGKDDLVDDGICFNSAATTFYRESVWDLASFTVLTDSFGLDLQRRGVFHIYGCPPEDMAVAEGPLLRQMAAISSVSRYIRDTFCSIMKGWVSSDEIAIMPPGIPPAFCNQSAPASARNVDFVYAGRLVPRKGVDLILRSLAVLRSEHDLRPSVVIAGDGPMQDELMRCREELALTNQVHFTGPLSQDQLICLLDRARWFLYPVREPEAFGLAPLEAMARGVPAIVGEPPGGMADYVESLRNGFMLGQSDVEHLAATMRTACVDLALRDRMVANCVKTAHQYSWAEFTDRVNAFFSDACESVV